MPDVQVAILSAKPAMYAFGSPMNPRPKFGDAMIARYVLSRTEPVWVVRLSVNPLERVTSQ